MVGREEVITYNLSEVDPSLLKVLSDWSGGRDVRNSHNALDLAKLYPLWYIEKVKRLPTSLKFEIPKPPKDPQTIEDWNAYFGKPKKKAVIIRLPKARAFRKYHYSWVKHIDLPKGNWVLITLTLSRDISKQDAWANINKWVSDFLQRFRVYLRLKGGVFHYMVAIERHSDDYPHVHILASFPFVPIGKIVSWWRDNQRQLSAFQGVDVKFLGNNVEAVKSYVIKYLVKDFPKLWAFHIDKDLNVKVRVSTLFIWYFRVRLLMMSKSISRLRVRPVPSSSDNSFSVFVGYACPHMVWSYYYKPYGIPKSQFWLCFLDAISLEKDWVFWDSILTVRYAKIG
jgi:hypothetical protein